MKKSKKEPVAFRVLEEDKKEIVDVVHKLLKAKGYKLYEKQNKNKARKKAQG